MDGVKGGNIMEENQVNELLSQLQVINENNADIIDCLNVLINNTLYIELFLALTFGAFLIFILTRSIGKGG